MNRLLQFVAHLFSQPQARRSVDTPWIEEEEQKQRRELRDRLERLRQQLWELERRHTERRDHI